MQSAKLMAARADMRQSHAHWSIILVDTACVPVYPCTRGRALTHVTCQHHTPSQTPNPFEIVRDMLHPYRRGNRVSHFRKKNLILESTPPAPKHIGKHGQHDSPHLLTAPDPKPNLERFNILLLSKAKAHAPGPNLWQTFSKNYPCQGVWL